ncbi:hypothetical protein P2G88_09995 [Aliiglaciecola sp. CAU 1673]|uniref:hypothetical protein n=1 Tax=Aliiglaciecola sp. CAU 1673 TaxID=3032595 RepID=UPI0023DC05CA|nr:hypothetical protein [Aliiglaciecola sp. CAU 1673]MDF2178580.1 hypothetical protein [Aliiglaciecola sp. CAU 1673]
MKNLSFVLFLLLVSVSSVSSVSYSEVLSPEELKDEFGGYSNFGAYKKLNKEVSVGDYTFCEFDRDEALCLLGLKSEKYAVDIKNPNAMEIVWEANENGIFEPVRLEALDKVEHELLSHFGLLVNKKLLSFQVFKFQDGLVKSKRMIKEEMFSVDYPNGCGTDSTHNDLHQ